MGRLELELENSTPLLVGWYRPELADPQGIRPTEVKGLWRWWARAFIGGVLYDEGLLRGSSYGSVLLKPTRDEVELIAKLVGEELGLGLAVSGESRASKFVLYVESLGRISPEDMGGRWAREWQRIRLLTLGNRAIKGLRPGSKFRLYVEWDDKRRPQYLDTALKILLIALQLTGVGKGSRRGLGSLDVVSVRAQEVLVEEELKNLRSLFDKAYTDCLKIVRVSEFVKEYSEKGRGKSSSTSKTQLPPLPVISKKTVFSAPVTEVRVIGDVSPTMFARVHSFFLRSQRCVELVNIPSCVDDLRNTLSAWFLGLPRTQRGTGYFAEVSRRASPMILTFHAEKNLFGGGVFVSVFLSGDWPKVIKWCEGSPRFKSIDVNDDAISKAYDALSREFEAYLNKLGIGRNMRRVWP